MDNEFKRRLIRHLETACRAYHRRLDPKTRLDLEPMSTEELGKALDDCIRLIVLLKPGKPEQE
jgi:hypothetical protein